MISTTPLCKQEPVVLQAIQSWVHWETIVEGAKKEYGMSKADVDAALPEYQRFMGLIASGNRRLSMFSIPVDKIWHAHILNTQLYSQFCTAFIGHFVHHAPILGVDRDCLEPEDVCANKCDTGPDTDPIPVPPKPPEPPKDELSASVHFQQAYIKVYGEAPSAIWNLPEAEVDGIALK